jgi:hypothetical protein
MYIYKFNSFLMESLLIVNIGYVYLNTNRMIFRLKRGYIKIKKWGKLIPHFLNFSQNYLKN